MGGIGWQNPVPFEVGGGETDDELVYEALRRAVGEGGAAENDSGIDGLWRQCKAIALASLGTFAERATLQAFPNLATDHIPVYEDLLGIIPGADATDVDRRAEITAAFTRKILSTLPDIRTQLRAIDARASVIEIPNSVSTIVVRGKAFEPQDGTPDYGPKRSTAFPNFALDFHTVVQLATSTVVPSAADLLVIRRIKRYLRDVLASWCSFAVVTSTGFLLDVSPLDLTGMTES